MLANLNLKKKKLNGMTQGNTWQTEDLLFGERVRTNSISIT